MEIGYYDLQALQNNFDSVKDCIIETMIDEGLLTEELGRDFSISHTMIIKNKSKISSFFRKLFKEKDMNDNIFCAKIKPIVNYDKEE